MIARISIGCIKEALLAPLVGPIVMLVAAICAGCASQGTSPALDTSQAASAEPPSAHTSPAPDRAAGMRVYKDPRTGEITGTPPPASPPPPVEQSFHRSHEGLVAVPNTAVPGGGVKVDLQGRFRSHFIATKDAEGNVSVHCVPESELPKP